MANLEDSPARGVPGGSPSFLPEESSEAGGSGELSPRALAVTVPQNVRPGSTTHSTLPFGFGLLLLSHSADR